MASSILFNHLPVWSEEKQCGNRPDAILLRGLPILIHIDLNVDELPGRFDDAGIPESRPLQLPAPSSPVRAEHQEDRPALSARLRKTVLIAGSP